MLSICRATRIEETTTTCRWMCRGRLQRTWTQFESSAYFSRNSTLWHLSNTTKQSLWLCWTCHQDSPIKKRSFFCFSINLFLHFTTYVHCINYDRNVFYLNVPSMHTQSGNCVGKVDISVELVGPKKDVLLHYQDAKENDLPDSEHCWTLVGIKCIERRLVRAAVSDVLCRMLLECD